MVLSQRFEAPFALPPFALYRALRRVNPAPFLFYLDFADFQIVGSSPEILVRVRDDTVTIRPIAGTRRRGATPAEDEALAAELLADPKERAEHLMLLDLGRNDVGRVARDRHGQGHRLSSSSSATARSCTSSRMSRGRLDPQPRRARRAGGRLSGRHGLGRAEGAGDGDHRRTGARASAASMRGCVGYFGANGEMDTCIVLRTAVVKDGSMYVQAGAGIVCRQSNPETEQQECVNKAKALFRPPRRRSASRRAGRGQWRQPPA